MFDTWTVWFKLNGGKLWQIEVWFLLLPMFDAGFYDSEGFRFSGTVWFKQHATWKAIRFSFVTAATVQSWFLGLEVWGYFSLFQKECWKGLHGKRCGFYCCCCQFMDSALSFWNYLEVLSSNSTMVDSDNSSEILTNAKWDLGFWVSRFEAILNCLVQTERWLALTKKGVFYCCSLWILNS